MTIESVTHECLRQLLAWRDNLDFSKKIRKRKDCNDKRTIQSIQYWYKSYLNGLKLMQG